MKLDEIINIISSRTNTYVNQSMLADALGITRQTISNRIKNDSQVTVSELKRIEEFFGISIFNDNVSKNDDSLLIDYYPDVFASCGQGNIVFSDNKEQISFSTSLIKGFSKNKKYSMINATGNSMSPTIDDGDKLIVEHWDGTQIQDNKIYVFCFNSEFFVKRLAKNLDELIIKSDNSEYRTRTININSSHEMLLVGKIVGIIKAL